MKPEIKKQSSNIYEIVTNFGEETLDGSINR